MKAGETMSTTWKPTNKWIAAQCTAVSALAISWVNAGVWSRPLTAAAIGVVAQATAAYLVSNGEATTGADTDEVAASETTTGIGAASGVTAAVA
jgi:hypothetical protein